CDTQSDIDRLWERFLADGGVPNQCGWLNDKFGLSWQIIPANLDELLRDPDRARAQRAMAAMLGMQKLDVDALVRAADAA
ncbi:MAG: VOC family protein, partial [Acidimicrobiia bacterium]